MAAVAQGLAQRVGHLMERLPSWREAGALLRRTPRGTPPGALAGLIESQVIPRLLVAHRDLVWPPEAGAPTARHDGRIDPKLFAERLLSAEAADLSDEVRAMLDAGATPRALCLELFAPAARVLGVAWEQDTVDFVDVTMALWRLQELLREVEALAPPRPRRDPSPRRAVFATVEGDQHVFGAAMLESFFLEDGWATQRTTGGLDDELVAAVATEAIDLVGLSVSRPAQFGAATELIVRVRRASLNPALIIMAGGPAVQGRAEIASAIGADATAADAEQALAVARSLTGERAAAARC